MPKSSQWSIGRLFLWTLVAALIASHLPNLYQRQIVGFTDFSLGGSDVRQWIAELDPSAKSWDGGEGSSRWGSAVVSDFDYFFTSKNATSGQILAHLESKIAEQLNEQNWSLHGGGSLRPGNITSGSDSFEFHVYNGYTHFRIYVWLVPCTDVSYARELEEFGGTVTRIKLLRVGFIR